MTTEQLCDERLITEFGKKRYILFLNITSQTQARFCYNFYLPNVFFILERVRKGEGWLDLDIAMRVSVCLSVRDHIFETARPIFVRFLCMLPMAAVRSSSYGESS